MERRITVDVECERCHRLFTPKRLSNVCPQCLLITAESALPDIDGVEIGEDAWKRDRALVDRLLNIEHGLTEWEVEFAESLSKRLRLQAGRTGARFGLTPRQRRKVEQILDRKEDA